MMHVVRPFAFVLSASAGTSPALNNVSLQQGCMCGSVCSEIKRVRPFSRLSVPTWRIGSRVIIGNSALRRFHLHRRRTATQKRFVEQAAGSEEEKVSIVCRQKSRRADSFSVSDWLPRLRDWWFQTWDRINWIFPFKDRTAETDDYDVFETDNIDNVPFEKSPYLVVGPTEYDDDEYMDRVLDRTLSAKRVKRGRFAQFVERTLGRTPFELPDGYVPIPYWHIVSAWLICLISLVYTTLGMYKMMVRRADFLSAVASSQQDVVVDRFIPRRTIKDSHGELLAFDRPMYDLWVHPKYFNYPKEEVAASLAPILNRDKYELVSTLGRGATGIPLQRRIDENTARALRKLNVSGLDLIQNCSREYPQQELAAEVIGYVDHAHVGQAGIELSQQELLQKTDDRIRTSRAGTGALSPNSTLSYSAFKGEDLSLKLHLDLSIQRAAREALEASLEKFHAKRGTVIVLDVNDGAIKTLVTAPTYNPNQFFKAPMELFKNWAITDMFEPGSTFKPLNVAIALESGAIQPTDVIFDEGRIYVGGWPVENVTYRHDKSTRHLSISEVLERSSNVGMVHIMQRVQPKLFYKWLKRLGLGSTLQTDMPFASQSSIKPQSVFTTYAIEPATASFGQGFALTPMKLAQLHASLANGGKLVTPHVVHGLFDGRGKLVWQPEMPNAQRIFSEDTTAYIRKFMERVIDQGTGKPCRIDNVRIAGKTGTAQKASPGGRYGNAFVTSFVAVYPSDSPRYVILCMVDEPQGRDAFGSTVSIPVVRATLQAIISAEQSGFMNEMIVALPPSVPNSAATTTPNVPPPNGVVVAPTKAVEKASAAPGTTKTAGAKNSTVQDSKTTTTVKAKSADKGGPSSLTKKPQP